MRLLRFFTENGDVHLGRREGDRVLDLGAASPLAVWDADPPQPLRSLPYDGLKLDAPIRESRKLLALAGNYRKHIAESGFAAVDDTAALTPQVFSKPPSTAINRPGGAVLLRDNNVFVDWEIELAVVIGRQARRVKEPVALKYVFGYTVINDISERKLNSRLENRQVREFDPFFDWLNGKWFDGHAPLGPEIVTADELGDPHHLALRLWRNGELMQDGNTSQMIFDVPKTIAYISSIVTLEPGDIIAMGTPDGVGIGRGIALAAGDRLTGEIEGIGRLETVIGVEESE